MSDVIDSVAPASAPELKFDSSQTFDSPREAVAELERRTNARREARRADKAEREDKVAEARAKAAKVEAEMEADLDDDGEEPDPRKVDKTEDKPDKPEKAKVKAKDTDDGEEAADEDTDDAGDDVPAEEDEAEDGDEDDDSDKLKTSEKLKVGDTEVEIPKGTPKAAVEAIKSLQQRLTSDYTRKTQEVAQGRQAVAQRAQEIEAQTAQVLQAQETVTRMAEQMLGHPPSIELAQTDIQQYTIQKALYEQRMAQLQGLGQQGQALRQQQAQEQQAQQEQRRAQEAQQMLRVLPALSSPEARQRFSEQAVAVAGGSGFSPDDVAAVSDHRMLHLLARLMYAESQLQAFNKAGSSVKTRLANVPPKAVRGGNASSDQGKGARTQKASQEFMSSKRSLADVKRFLAQRGD